MTDSPTPSDDADAPAVNTRGPVTRRLFPDGEDPDPRFTLANERTFLAWIRTSLAFLAAGVALEAFPVENVSPTLRTMLSVTVIALGMLIAAGAAGRWVSIERAMRRGQPLPIPLIVPLLAFGAVAAAVLALWVFVLA